MKYLSLFSGIEAATVAWHELSWECVGVSEIDPFACEVLKQRLPHIPNLGDITKITKEELNEKFPTGLDIVVGGSPCQAFSVAGLRKGLEDPRGNLMLEYIRIVATIRPTYFIWENVPGVLSSNRGRDFGTLLQAMEKLGYQLCWRTFDSKNFGVPQRRRRVFLVGSLANNRHPFEILFESESMPRNNTKSRETRQNNTTKTTSSTQERIYTAEKQYASTLCARDHKGIASDSFGHDSQQLVNTDTKVRRLTPIECERLQGFPDNWTQIAWRGKEPKDCPISHRYRCLGNSMTTNVMRWIGERICN